MQTQSPDALKQNLRAIAAFIWISRAGFDLLIERSRTDPTWNWQSQTKHHGQFHIGPLLDSLRKPDSDIELQSIQFNFFVVLARSSLSNAFECVKAYCNQKGQYRYWTRQSWFYFLRAIRNAFTHDGNLTYEKDNDKQRILKSNWRGKQIDESMFGKPIPLSFFDFDDLIRMIDDLSEFCDQLPQK